jgi:heme exporter protein D
MRWQSWAEFWHMGGYGLYVWGSVGVCALLMLIEVWQARAARRQVLAQLQTDIAWDDMTANETTSNDMASNGAQQDTAR